MWEADMSVFPIRILPWEEIRGQLHAIIEQEGGLVAIIGLTPVVLPKALWRRLQDFEGKKIGIVRTDLDFRLRNLEMEDHVTSDEHIEAV
jgi:hypothetical protein